MVASLGQFQYEWVTQPARLASLCERWLNCAVLAVDTEFIRVSTYFPIVGLIQIADGQGVYLVDPLACEDLSPLAAVFKCPSVLKVIYAASEDLEVFQRCLGVLPMPLFDAQVAASLAGLGSFPGYSATAEILQAVIIPKEETRSDWLQRPLRDTQCQYAAADVFYLHRMYFQLAEKLRQQGRYEWACEDSASLLNNVSSLIPAQGLYRRVKGRGRLNRRQLAVLRLLAQWREEQARLRDIPKTHVCKDGVLLGIARVAPRQTAQLSQVAEISASFIRRSGEQLVELVAEASRLEESCWPELEEQPLSRAAREIMEKAKAGLAHLSERMQLQPELLARKRDLIELACSGEDGEAFQLPVGLRGWREAEVGRPLLVWLEN